MSGIMLAHRAAFHGGIVLPAIGAAFYGGYYAGIIDTTKGNIIAADANQVGRRYAVIVSPISLEVTGYAWKTTNDAGPLGVQTRWDGLGATSAMNAAGAAYQAAQYCWALSYGSDGGSHWYLPAMDEMHLVQYNLKPTTDSNNTSTPAVGTFPPTASGSGYDPSSDPPAPANTATVPAQTSVAAFKSGGAQALGTGIYYSTATEYSATNQWVLGTTGTNSGRDFAPVKSTAYQIRPVRRVYL